MADVDPAVLGQLSSQLTVAAEPLLDCLMENQDFPRVRYQCHRTVITMHALSDSSLIFVYQWAMSVFMYLF